MFYHKGRPSVIVPHVAVAVIVVVVVVVVVWDSLVDTVIRYRLDGIVIESQ